MNINMNMNTVKKLVALTTLIVPGLALAAADCPSAPQNTWLPVLDMQKKIVNDYGFAIKRFQTDGNCYEIYGWGLNDAKTRFVEIEVYFNPVTGAIVKKKLRD